MKSQLRNGCFTSSEIVNLLSFGTRDMTPEELEQYKKDNPKGRKTTIECWPGDAAITYINQCNMERRLGRSLDSELDAKPTNWGKFLEELLFTLLDEDYTYNSSETLVHPEYDFWVGTPDGHKISSIKTIIDTKCPYTLESFCKLVNPLYEGLKGMDAIRALMNGYVDSRGLFQKPHKDAKKYYWQLVSNACITGATHAELIVYCPYESELGVIQAAAIQSGEPSVYFIANGSANSLPSIPDGGYYSNINTISFEVPQNDKDYLTQIVKKAGKYLI